MFSPFVLKENIYRKLSYCRLFSVGIRFKLYFIIVDDVYHDDFVYVMRIGIFRHWMYLWNEYNLSYVLNESNVLYTYVQYI